MNNITDEFITKIRTDEILKFQAWCKIRNYDYDWLIEMYLKGTGRRFTKEQKNEHITFNNVPL